MKYNKSLVHGYADIPGTGPAGEYCSTCKHAIKLHSRWNRWRCLANRQMWVPGKDADILLTSAACELWKASANKNP